MFFLFLLKTTTALLQSVEQSRYLFRTHKYSDRKKVFNWSDAVQENSKRFSADEFRTEFRMSRHSFNAIFPLIHQHKVFNKEGIGRKQYAVQLQLLVFLKRIGSEGAEGNSQKIANESRSCIQWRNVQLKSKSEERLGSYDVSVFATCDSV